MIEELRSGLSGVVGITVTPFDDRDRIDEDAYRAVLRRALSPGVPVITPNGNTSEFYSLSPAERLRAVELTAEVAGDALMLPGVGLDLESAIAEARRYAELGAAGVMVHQPVHPFWSAVGWVDYHRRIADAVPQLGIVPYLRSPSIGEASIRELRDACPNLAGVKYAVPDPAAFAGLVAALGQDRIAWVCGLAETWAPFFAGAGAVGFTSGLVNVDPDRSLRMLAALRDRDEAGAMSLWAGVRTFEGLRARASSEMNVSVVKEALEQLGLCSARVRPPLGPVTQADREAIATVLESWGLERIGS